jgi:hypothetical protein
MAIRIHCNNFLWVAPLRERSDLRSRLCVGEVRLVSDVEVFACYSKRIVYGV